MIVVLASDDHPARGARTLTFYCAAGIKPPVEKVARDYENRYGVRIDLTYGGSGTLLSNIEVVRQGDLYLAADDSYLELAREKRLVAETLALATMRPVIGVARGNPKGVRSMQDLLRPDVRVGLANPDAAAIGKVTRSLLRADSTWNELESRVKVYKPTVNELANDLVIGSIDAAVIWDAVANQYPKIDAVPVERFQGAARNIAVGVLVVSSQPAAALSFARFLASRDRGRPHFAAFGYETLDGDVWDPRPELVLMCGAMLNKAIDRTITQFENREGVRVTRIYNGCGILVAQMKSGTEPDAYFSCDQSFLDMVDARFEPATTVSENRIVLLVRKGNPHALRQLQDLNREGLRVGLAHAEKSALGALTRDVLRRKGLWQALIDSGNVVVWSPTGDFLVNQIRTGSLDATIVYRSNAAMIGDELERIEIDDPSALAVQPYAVSESSKHKHTMRRLLDAILEQRSRRRFEELGFGWRAASGR